MGNLLQKMTFSPQQTAPTLRFLLTMTHVDQRCQSSHHQNSLPGPLPWQWHRCHHASATSSESQRQRGQIVVLGWLLFFFGLKILQGKSASPSLCTLTLRNFPQAACSPQHRSAMTAWETWAGEEEGEKTGGRRVLLSCCLALLFVRPFPRPVGAAERMQISPQMRTYRRRSYQRRERIRKEGGNFGRTRSDGKRC